MILLKLKNNYFKAVQSALLQFMLCTTVFSQIQSPFNSRFIIDTTSNYSFFVSGHFHGASTNASTYPASTLLANIDTINKEKGAFIMCLGDLFIDVNETILEHYHTSFFTKINLPLFNAIGNHDLANGNIYKKYFGASYFSFTMQSELYVVLNTELNDGDIVNEQLEFLKSTLSTKNIGTAIKNIFIFSHRPIWAEGNIKYDHYFKENTHTQIGNNNFEIDLKPLLKKLSPTFNLIWISGSMGGAAPVSFFYDKDSETNITYLQTAIRELPRDALLKIGIANGKINFSGFSLTNQKLKNINEYNINFWNNTVATEQKFNFRMIPFYIKQILLHAYFWIGCICSTLVIICLFFFFKKRKT